MTALFRLAVCKSVLHVHRLLLPSGMVIDGLIRQNIALAPGASSSGGKTVPTRQKHGVRDGGSGFDLERRHGLCTNFEHAGGVQLGSWQVDKKGQK